MSSYSVETLLKSLSPVLPFRFLIRIAVIDWLADVVDTLSMAGLTMKAEERELWNQYRAGRSEEALRALATFYVPLIEQAANHVAHRTDYKLQADELLGSGYTGLRRAIELFDESRGVPFKGYAWTRVRGAILDYLREDVDELSRLERRRLNQVRKAKAELQREGNADPTTSDIADRTGMSRVEVERVKYLSLRVYARWHLDLAVREENGTMTFGDLLCNDVRREAEVDNITEIVREGLAILPNMEAAILRGHYLDEMTLKQVGKQMGISESRACQLEARAMRYLRESAWYRRNNAA